LQVSSANEQAESVLHIAFYLTPDDKVNTTSYPKRHMKTNSSQRFGNINHEFKILWRRSPFLPACCKTW